MYKLPPLYKPIEVTPIPDCVYKMKKISDHFNSGNASNCDASVVQIEDAELVDLDKRWTEITSRLEKLQSEITAYKSISSGVVTATVPPAPPSPPVTVEVLSVQQGMLLTRISSLMSSLSDLKMRLAVMDDPKNYSSTVHLQLKQKSLLERIKELNDEIRAISFALSNNNNGHNKNHSECRNICQPQRCIITQESVPIGTQEFQDLVITASPARPPHSLPLIKQQLEKLGMSVYATTHVHSTAALDKLVTDELRNFIHSAGRVERSQAQLAITLVWRKEKDDEPTLMVSPAKQAAPVKGEANIVRYLVRSVPRLLDYESDALRAARLDELLELTIATGPLGAGGSKKDRAAALQSIEQTLAKSQQQQQQQSLDGGNELSAVDFVVYSAIVNSKPVDKELGPKTKAWMARCKPATDTLQASAVKRMRIETYLAELGIVFQTIEHPAVFTVAAMMEHVACLPGLHAKNLLVKDKKSGRLFLITARHDAPVQLNQLAKSVGAKELRFADAETLASALGVEQGSVTPFALLNDAANRRVTLVLDAQLWDESAGSVNFHPLTNEATTNVTVTGFKTFLKATGHEPIVIQL